MVQRFTTKRLPKSAWLFTIPFLSTCWVLKTFKNCVLYFDLNATIRIAIISFARTVSFGHWSGLRAWHFASPSALMFRPVSAPAAFGGDVFVACQLTAGTADLERSSARE